MTVKETTITLLDNPQKQVTVWAYTLKGTKPSVPGPHIRVSKGDLVRIHFTNTHNLPHTMHFHGVHPFNMDGNGQRDMGVEQLQMPGESYTYEWVAEDPGFYFYHCHFDTANHLDHGMYGLFVVEDPDLAQGRSKNSCHDLGRVGHKWRWYSMRLIPLTVARHQTTSH